MEIDDSLRKSIRRQSSSSSTRNTWGGINAEDNVFNKSLSSRRSEQDDFENDEDALKWAAIEKLPSYLRIRRSILTDQVNGGSEEIDVRKLGAMEKRSLLGRLVNLPQDDNENFLLRLKRRIDRVGVSLPTIEVRFERLNVNGEAYAGSRALPTVLNFFVSFFEDILNFLHVLPSKKSKFTILHDASGIIKPERMTLLLGPPSSGKTTFLLALAGKLDSNLEVSGRVTHNGHEMKEFTPERTSAYISQYDLHLGELTVRETLAFSARVQGVGSRYEILKELIGKEKEANIKPDPDIDVFMKAASLKGQEANIITDYIIKILGLETCADTMAGNEMMRGISGGQRKRLTLGEMIVGPAKALFMDEISNGLDTSTTFQIVNSIKQYIHIFQGTAVVSLLQPAPETYSLFDDVILLSDGYIVYQGPRENVLEFFQHMGFRCPDRKGVADFLQEVTSEKDQEQYWARREEPYNFISSKEFSDAFWSFPVGQRLSDRLVVPFNKSKDLHTALTAEKYGISKKELLKACFARELIIMKRNLFVYIYKFFRIFFMASITLTVFLRTEMPKETVIDAFKFLGALFFTLSVLMFNGISELALTLMRLPSFYKQRDFLFFPAWAYSLPTWILSIPFSLLEASVWVSMVYYSIGFESNIQSFFKQFLTLACTSQMALAMFRLIAAAARNNIISFTFGSYALLGVLVLGGYILSKENINKFWIWGYWASPVTYAQNAIALNEFLGQSWSHVTVGFEGPLGVSFLKSRGLFSEAKMYWVSTGALIGHTVLFNCLITLALTFLKPLGRSRAVVPPGAMVHGKDSKVTELAEKRSLSSRAMSSRVDNINMAKQNGKRGMNLPFEPHSIIFDDIKYAVDMPREIKALGITEDRLELLKGVSGAFRPGVLTALMGVSGAGKTTLMDVLAGRKTGGYISGNITISGYPKKQDTFARIAGYCEQTDIHSPHLTLYESLQFSSWLRIPPEVNSETRKLFIEEVMEVIELTSIRDALVGLPGQSGLSIDQRKRLTIAVELVANPSIIFMDEPTSGLDARAAAIVMRTVRNTVDTGRTVVCTIHQPSIDIFDAFDELLLLKPGGEEIYVGPIGRHSSLLIQYFEGINGVSKIKNGYNPATWMLEVTTVAQEEALGVNFADLYRSSELHRETKELIKELSKPAPDTKDIYFPKKYSQHFFTQCMICLWKQHWSYWRNPSYTGVRLLFTAFMALLLGTIFWNLGTKRNGIQDIFNAMGSMYAAVLFLGIQNGVSVQPVVAVERTVFYRERAAGMYSALPYAFGQVMIEVPYCFIQALIYCAVVYPSMGFEWKAEKFLWYFVFMYLTILYFTFYAMMGVAVTPNHAIGSLVSSAFYSLWNLFSGFIIPRTRLPVWWRWYYYLCPVAWSMYGLVASQFGDVKVHIDDIDATVEDFVRDYLGFKHDFIVYCFLILVAFVVVFAFTFAYAIKTFNFQRR